MKKMIFLLLVLCSVSLGAQQREYIWPEGRMPDAQAGQIAAMTDEVGTAGFNPDEHRIPYLEWFPAPDKAVRKDVCMILISGGSYMNCCDVGLIQYWKEELTRLGVQCVNFVYRTPRPEGLPIYQTAWEDGQRAVRMVRSEARKRGFDPEKIGVISMSAGSHLALLLATGSLTKTYEPVDALDRIPCHINWAIVNAPAYVTTDGETGTPATREGYGSDVQLSSVFPFDEKTCPMSLHHGGLDPYSPNGSTLVYRQLRRMGIPAELHLYPDKGHGAFGFERGVEFMTQMGFLGPVEPEVELEKRFPDDVPGVAYSRENLWPEGRIPDARPEQCIPYLEWYIPENRTTDAIQIIYSGGAYVGNDPSSFEVAPARRYLNALGIPVVTMKYRSPRPEGLAKHTTAWQDLQRAVRLVRSEAPSHGLDPGRIGIMGSSAGGHLTLLGVTSSRHRSYLPVDAIDNIPCNVQWGIGIYPAYALTDGLNSYNKTGGNDDTALLAPEFSFDADTAPMLFLHGDADGYASMNSVKVWEKMRAMGIQSELHTLATREHCFQRTASPGTGSYNWLDRIAEFLQTAAAEPKGADFRLLYWNIQNGMWDGQPDHYDRFVAWVKAQQPDVCVFCEAASIFRDGTDDYMADEEKYLPGHWAELAARYGHQYVFLGGWRDDYPQVITSRYPIEEVARITGNADTLVCHGAGWARLRVHGKELNIVTLHTWPQAYGFRVPKEDRERSKAAREGDYYRRTEMEYICSHTIGTIPSEEAAGQYWMMMGDFNSRSRVDNWVYHYPEDDSRLLVHDYIHATTPYLDVVHERHPNDFYTTIGGRGRIDYVYCTRPLFDCIVSDRIVSDDYTTPIRNPQNISNFWHPSDHRPIIVDFDL